MNIRLAILPCPEDPKGHVFDPHSPIWGERFEICVACGEMLHFLPDGDNLARPMWQESPTIEEEPV